MRRCGIRCEPGCRLRALTSVHRLLHLVRHCTERASELLQFISSPYAVTLLATRQKKLAVDRVSAVFTYIGN